MNIEANMNPVYKFVRRKVVNGTSLVFLHPASHFRYLRKAALYLKDISGFVERVRLAKQVTAEPGLDKETLRLLKRDGYAPATGLELLDELGQEVARRAGTAKGLPGKQTARAFFRYLLTKDDYNSESIFLRFATQKKVVAMATAYLGQLPHINHMQVTVSTPTPPDRKLEESQLWHEDYDDSSMLKLMVYLTDVTSDDDGPFTFIKAPLSDKVRNSFYPGRITDEEMDRQLGSGYATAVKAPRLSAFYIDTRRCYHMGSRCRNLRMMMGTTFTTMAPLHDCEFKVRLSAEDSKDPIKRLILPEQ